jgi:MFS family permease
VSFAAERGDVGQSGGSLTLSKRIGLLWGGKQFSPMFWTFFAAAFFYDFGVGLYFFLFNLFLANLHFNEKAIGLITGALTLGNVAGTIPVSLMARRFGLQRLLLFCFVGGALLCIIRTLIVNMPAQIALAFFTGAALSCWPVCFAPVVARLTSEDNRVSAFSIVFATGIGSGTLAGIVGGYLPEVLKATGATRPLVDDMRIVLLFACGIVLLGVWPVLRLRLGPPEVTENRRFRLIHPFLFRFLPPFALWSLVTGSFIPFAAIYLQQHLGIPLGRVGLIFSASQLTQFSAVLLAPLLYRRFGTITGIMCTQVATGAAVFALGRTHDSSVSVACYLSYSGLQFMSGPGIYSLLMNRIPDSERSTASAVQNIVGALSQAAAAVITGSMLVRYGYPKVLAGNGGVALAAALLLYLLLGSLDTHKDGGVTSTGDNYSDGSSPGSAGEAAAG